MLLDSSDIAKLLVGTVVVGKVEVASWVLVCPLVAECSVEKVLLDSVVVVIALIGSVVVGEVVVFFLVVSGILVCFRVDRG